MPMDVWIGDDGYVHRRSASSSSSGLPFDHDHGQTELYDLGTDVNVTVPSDDEVVDLTQLLTGQS